MSKYVGQMMLLALVVQVAMGQALDISKIREKKSVNEIVAVEKTVKNLTDELIAATDYKKSSRKKKRNDVNIFTHNAAGLDTNTTLDSVSGQRYYVDITEVLQQFDNIDAALDQAIAAFQTDNMRVEQRNDQIRQTRDSSILSPRPTCKVSNNGLYALKDAIDHVVSTKNVAQENINCIYESGNLQTTNCEEIFKIIKCGVSHVKEAYTKIRDKSISDNDYNELKNERDELAVKLQRVVDELRLESSQSNKILTDTYNTEISKIKSELRQLKDTIAKLNMKLCISEIHSEKIENAKGYFIKLNDDSKVSAVIQKSYNYFDDENKDSNSKLNNVKNILNFIRSLPSVSQDSIAYNALFKEMEENNHLNSPKVLMFENRVQQSLNWASNPEIENSLTILKNKLSKYVTGIIDSWSSSIRSENYNSIYDYAKYDRHSLRSYLGQLIKKVYSNNLANVENILKFIRGLP